MAVLYFYLVKTDASACKLLQSSDTVSYKKSHVLKVTRTTRSCITGHPVCIIT